VDGGVIENPEHGRMEQRPDREFPKEISPLHAYNLTHMLRKWNIFLPLLLSDIFICAIAKGGTRMVNFKGKSQQKRK